MPKGWNQAHQGESRPAFTFDCTNCGHSFESVTYNKLTFRRLSGVEYWASASCPECRSSVKHEMDGPLVEAVGRKPNKPFDKLGQTIMIHGRDRNVYPADLKETIERANALYEARQLEMDDGKKERQEESDGLEDEASTVRPDVDSSAQQTE